MTHTDPDDERELAEASGACPTCGQPLDRPQCAICAEFLPYFGARCANAHDPDHTL